MKKLNSLSNKRLQSDRCSKQKQADSKKKVKHYNLGLKIWKMRQRKSKENLKKSYKKKTTIFNIWMI